MKQGMLTSIDAYARDIDLLVIVYPSLVAILLVSYALLVYRPFSQPRSLFVRAQ